MKFIFTSACVLMMLIMSSCKQQEANSIISIDGSSTVFPIVEAVAEEYNKKNPKVKINIGVSGTGGGFKKFTIGETDISNASRTIKAEEIKKAQENNINFLEIPVAFDGITVVVNKNNTWATEMTTDELKKIWDKGSQVHKWSDVRPNWPDRPIKLYGPGTDSGTFDYFTEAINGKSQVSRDDFTKSEDDNILVTGVAGELDSLGYFGYSYYKENQDKIKAVSISHKKNPGVLPDMQTINNQTYNPLSRTVFIYVNTQKLKQNKNLKEFLNFFMETAAGIVTQVGYVQLNDEQYKRNLINLEKHFLQ